MQVIRGPLRICYIISHDVYFSKRFSISSRDIRYLFRESKKDRGSMETTSSWLDLIPIQSAMH